MEPTLEKSYQSPIGEKPNTKKGIGFLVALFALLLILVYVMSISFSKDSSEDVATTRIDVADAEGRGKLPDGFPSDIPVETDSVIESYASVYGDQNVTVYATSFQTKRDRTEVFNEYLTFVSEGGYMIYTISDKPDTKSIYAKKGDASFSFSLSPMGAESLINLAYLARN